MPDESDIERKARTRIETRERETIDLGLADPLRNRSMAARNRASTPSTQAPPGRLAGAARTLRSMVGFGAQAPQASRHLADLAAAGLPQDGISDAEAMRRAGHDAAPTEGCEPVPRRPETLPAIVSRAMSVEGGAKIVPEWHMVRHLPGYLQSRIRQLGRQVFAPFTDTPIEDIQVLSTLSNPDRDVKAVATWIFRNGIRDDEAELEFGQIMPDYKANTQIWNVEGFTFMVVKDFAGHYVYSWPGGRGTQLDNDDPAPQLGRF
jgi:hypothetical protein